MQNESIYIAIKRPDNGVSIMVFLTQGRGNVLPSDARWLFDGWWLRTPTPEALAREISLVEPTALSWRILKQGDIPIDRTYRNAWTDAGATIEYDIIKARDIYRSLVRGARIVNLEALDIEWMKAIAADDKATATTAEAARQVLRDLPQDPRIDLATTVGELNALWPLELAKA